MKDIKRKHQPLGWCFSFAVGHPTEMKYPSNISYCSRRRSYANKFAPESLPVKVGQSKLDESVRGSQKERTPKLVFFLFVCPWRKTLTAVRLSESETIVTKVEMCLSGVEDKHNFLLRCQLFFK